VEGIIRDIGIEVELEGIKMIGEERNEMRRY